MWKKAMTYLGLGEDEDYVDYDEYEDPAPEQRRAPERRPGPVPERRPAVARDDIGEVVARGGTVRPLPNEPRSVEPTAGVGAVTARGGLQRGAVVRPLPVPVTAKPHIVQPGSFNEAQEVADKFRGNVPVIMNLQDADKELSRRLIDFASGLCYGLGGAMDRVASSVYLLTPTDVEVSAEDKARLQERGFSS